MNRNEKRSIINPGGIDAEKLPPVLSTILSVEALKFQQYANISN